MVGGRGICHSPRHEKPHRWCHVHGNRSRVRRIGKKQKLNTKSSTEAELVGIDHVLPQALWTKYFLEAQNYETDAILNQDNQSTIKLADNGKASSGRGTRHINIRYFFITDRIARKEIAMQYCPTKEMVANYFTKPLQGMLFYKFRDQNMGVVPMDTIIGDQGSVLDDHSTKAPSKINGARVARQSPSTTGTRWASRLVTLTSPKTRKRARDKTNGPAEASQDRRSWAEVAKTPPRQ
jgi:hypothetical protein